MPANQISNEQSFYTESLSNYKSQRLDRGSISNEFQYNGELKSSYNQYINSPRFIYPDTLLENVANRYKI